MTSLRRDKIVVLGMMTKMPVAGVVWQNLHYLLGFERLGYQAYYVEAHARTPSMLMTSDADDGAEAAADFIARLMSRFDLSDRWAYHALHSDGRVYGMSEARLRDLYVEAALIINLHGGTQPRAEHSADGKLIYVETDPVALQVELAQGVRSSVDFLEPHVAFFTFAENLGKPDCRVPLSDRFAFQPTRQPVVLDLWEGYSTRRRDVFTTIGNFRQQWRDVTFEQEKYHWSKHHEFLKFLDLPERTGASFELALSGYDEKDRELLVEHGWTVIDGLALSANIDSYRRHIASSLAEFTVAKDQNVRLRSGWFSDRSASYLASGRPVITQDTGFGTSLPVGEGLFPFSTLEDAEHAVDTIRSKPDRQEAAALSIAEEYFRHDVVLTPILKAVGLAPRSRASSLPASTVLTPLSRRPLILPAETENMARDLMPEWRPAASEGDVASASIVVVTYNGQAVTRLCLTSVLENTWYPHFEVIVVDNGSTDGTTEYLRDLSSQRSEVRLILNGINRGFAAACNQGLAAARGRLLLLLNNDTVVTPRWLAGFARHLADESIGAIGPVTNRIGTDAEVETNYRTYSEMLAFARQRYRQFRGQTVETAMLPLFCTAMRRDVFETIGPLDERFGKGLVEDDDYSMRLRAAGYRLVCAEDVFVHHFGEGSFGRLVPTGEYRRLLEANRELFRKKWRMTPPAHGAPARGMDLPLMEKFKMLITRLVPADVPALVITRGDDRLVDVDDRVLWHFPRDKTGQWAGYYPADSSGAVQQLVRQCALGARYLVIPAAGRWWLDYYGGLRQYLSRWATVVHDDATCIVFRIAPRSTLSGGIAAQASADADAQVSVGYA